MTHFDPMDVPLMQRTLFNATAEVFNECGLSIILLVLQDDAAGTAIVTAPNGVDKGPLIVLLKDFIRRLEQ